MNCPETPSERRAIASPANSASAGKKRYQTPQLVAHGDIRSRTLGPSAGIGESVGSSTRWISWPSTVRVTARKIRRKMEKMRRVLSLRALLAEVAARGRTISYEEVRSELGLTGDIVPLLRQVSVDEDEAGRGLLSAVVVRRDTGRPGAGWYRLAADRGRDVADRDQTWLTERARLREIHGRLRG